ncbi:hypothetical protein VR45_39230 [Streptomyces sp. NRRL S-495]|nr:hypothetical protein VR45_39230 [Streptomyces sp. NRRL S-495]
MVVPGGQSVENDPVAEYPGDDIVQGRADALPAAVAVRATALLAAGRDGEAADAAVDGPVLAARRPASPGTSSPRARGGQPLRSKFQMSEEQSSPQGRGAATRALRLRAAGTLRYCRALLGWGLSAME